MIRYDLASPRPLSKVAASAQEEMTKLKSALEIALGVADKPMKPDGKTIKHSARLWECRSSKGSLYFNPNDKVKVVVTK